MTNQQSSPVNGQEQEPIWRFDAIAGHFNKGTEFMRGRNAAIRLNALEADLARESENASRAWARVHELEAQFEEEVTARENVDEALRLMEDRHNGRLERMRALEAFFNAKCVACGEPTGENWYRCLQCEGYFHKRCLEEHVKEGRWWSYQDQVSVLEADLAREKARADEAERLRVEHCPDTWCETGGVCAAGSNGDYCSIYDKSEVLEAWRTRAAEAESRAVNGWKQQNARISSLEARIVELEQDLACATEQKPS